jgi:hypothetical protein
MIHELFFIFFNKLGLYGPGPLVHRENFLTHMIRDQAVPEQGQFKLSIDGDLGLQQDVARRVTDHDLIGTWDDLPALAEYVPVGE